MLTWFRENWFKILGLAGLIVLSWYFFQNNDVSKNTLKIPFPYTLSVQQETTFACEGLISAGIVGSSEEYLTNGIEGSVEKGTDKIAMEIKNDQFLTLLTSASVEAGITEGDEMAIIQNTSEKLMAVWFNEDVISTVVLNKKNGLGIWSKSNPDFLVYEAPYGSVIYLKCL